MGRNKKSNKHRKIRFINLKQYVIPFFISLLYIIGLIVTAAVLKIGSEWEIWKENHMVFPLIISLTLYRCMEYIFPAFFIKLLCKKDMAFSFNVLFSNYALIKAIIYFFGLDYALEIDPFSASDSFIIIIGYLISYLAKKNTEIKDSVEIVEEK